MKKLSLDDHAKIIQARWNHPEKYKRKIVVTDHGHGHYSVGFDKTSQEILAEIEADNLPPAKKTINFFKKLFS